MKVLSALISRVRSSIPAWVKIKTPFGVEENALAAINDFYKRKAEDALPLVVKKDARREPFNRLKIFSGLKRACEKRPISINMIEKIVNRIELHFQERGEREVKSSEIGERVMEELHRLDGVAYVRFASVYRQFKDIQEFMANSKISSGIRKRQRRSSLETVAQVSYLP